MGITINSPLPSSLASECRKAARILNSFTDDGKGVDFIIPPDILSEAKGLAIFTVLKAGFLFSGRAGSGLVVARLPDGSWSAPSAIVTGGVGFGGQVGAELTDFIMVLNTNSAVKTFMHHGSITLGGNISVAAGPVGRNAEASGTASIKSMAAVYSYSKTRGLFAGVSFEGSVIFERFDANKKLYGYKVKAKELLNGTVPPPPSAESLYRALDIKYGPKSANTRTSYLNRQPTNPSRPYSSNEQRSFDDSYRFNSDDSRSVNRQTGSPAMSFSRAAVHNMAKTGVIGRGNLESPSSWRDEPSPNRLALTNSPHSTLDTRTSDRYTSDPRELVLAPREEIRAQALYNFAGEQTTDLPFRKGDIIVVTKKTETQDDWWTGRLEGREGIFPANFVQVL